MTGVTRTSVTPLWEQVYRSLREDIYRGLYVSDSRLPSERLLVERFQISRITLRRALQALFDDGLVTSSMGRGWFASPQRPVSEPPNLLQSFSGGAAARGLKASSIVIDSGTRPTTLDEAETFGIAPGAALFHLKRVRLLDDLVISFDRNLVPLALAPGLAEVDFAHASLYEVFTAHGVIPTRSQAQVSAQIADEELADHLRTVPGGPILRLVQTTFDQRGRVIELGTVDYHGERYRFSATLTRGDAPQSPVATSDSLVSI